MALPSQGGRVRGTSKAYTTTRRSRAGFKAWLALAVLAAVVGGGWYWLKRDTPAAAPGEKKQAASVVTPAPKPAAAPLPPKRIEPQPLVEAPPVEVPKPKVQPQPQPKPEPKPESKSDPAPQLKPQPQPQPVAQPLTPPPPVPPTPSPVVTPAPAPAPVAAVAEPSPTTRLAEGIMLLNEGKLVEGRRAVSAVVLDDVDGIDPETLRTARQKLIEAGKLLVLSRRIYINDPLAEQYTVQAGDYLGPVARRYKVTHQLLEQINNVKAERIWVGQKLKMIKGPFHAVVDKSEYRMDIVLVELDGTRVLLTSYPVGLGEEGSTPVGMWRVRAGGKVTNPSWRNPRTGEAFTADDPLNPIGEYWVGLEGIDDRTRDQKGYGIHGTIDPKSIGTQASMGCIRMRDQDLAEVYHLLVDSDSTVEVRP